MLPSMHTAGLLLLAASSSALGAAVSPFKFYDLPTPMSLPCDICTGSDGAIWVSDQAVAKISRIDPKSGKVTDYVIPYTSPPLPNATLPGVNGVTALACAIQPGSDGNLYASSGLRNQLVRINPTTKNITIFTPPSPAGGAGNLQPFNDLWRGPTGMFVSQTSANVISLFDYKKETFTNFPVPNPSSPLGMRYANGYLWFTEFLGNKIGRLNAKTGNITLYDLPVELSGPAVMRAETQGTYLFFTALIGNAIGSINMKTGEIATYPAPTPGSFPTEDTNDNNGNVWYSTIFQNGLHKLNPKTGVITTINEPGGQVVNASALPSTYTVAIHYGPGNAIWFTQGLKNRIGRYQL